MGLTEDLSIPDINYSWFAPSLKDQFPSLWEAAFRSENDVANIIAYYSRPQFQDDPLFDFGERAKKSNWFLQDPDAFMDVRSEAEWAYTEARLEKEFKDRAAIANGGLLGIGAAVVAGVLSPTILIPVGGVATAGGSAIKAGAEGAALVMLGASIQEGALHFNQDLRTTRESMIGIAAAGAVGALLGASIQYATRKEIEKITADMVDAHRKLAVSPTTPPSAVGLSAQVVPTEEAIAAANPFIDPEGIAQSALPVSVWAKKLHLPKSVVTALSGDWFSPVTRGLASKSAVRRSVTAQLSTGALYTEAALRGTAVAEGGTVEQLIKQHNVGLIEALAEVNRLYREWYVNTGKGGRIRSRFAPKTQREFMEAVGDTMFEHIQGIRRADIPKEMHDAAELILDKVYRAEIKTAREAGLESWVQLRDEVYALQIATQRVRRDLVNEDRLAAKRIMVEHAIEVMKAAEKPADVGNEIAAVLGRGSNKIEYTSDELELLAEDFVDKILPVLLGEYGKHGVVEMMHRYGQRYAKYIYIDPTKVWSNGRRWGEFLERDVEKLARSFVRSMAPDVELWRKFRTIDPSVPDDRVKFWDLFAKEQDARAKEASQIADEAKRKEALREIAQERDDFARDLQVLVSRLRHTRGIPEDPYSFGHRLGKVALQLNTQRLMGGVVISSLADAARIIMRAGFTNTFRHGVVPLLRNFQQMQMAARELKFTGVPVDFLIHGRAGMMFDLFEETERGNLFERAMQYGTSKIGIIALFDYWNIMMKQFSSAVWLGTLSDAIEATSRGTATKYQKRLLAWANISEINAERMAELIKKGEGGTEVHPGVWMPNTEAWSEVTDEEIEAELRRMLGNKGYERLDRESKEFGSLQFKAFQNLQRPRRELQRNFRAALAQLVDSTIVTPGIERPNFIDASTAARLIMQFRSFTLSSTLQVVRLAAQDARAGNMAPVILGSMFSLALGALSYYIWAQSVGGRTRERMLNELNAALNGDSKAMRRWADEAFNRSGLMGVFAEGQKFVERVPGLGEYVTFAGTPPTRSPYINPVLDVFGPTTNIIENLGKIVMTLDNPESSTFRAAKQLLPYQNLMFVRQYLDKLNDELMRSVGVSLE